jgi:hypothetical protein
MATGDVQLLTDGGSVSLSALSRGFGCSRETVRNRLVAGNVQSTGQANGHPVYPLVPSLLALRAGDRTTAETVTSEEEAMRLPPIERKQWFDSEATRVKLQRDKGELVDRQDAREEMATLVKVLAAACDSIPDDLERELHLPAAAVAAIEDRLDAVRTQIAERLEAAA